MKTMFLLFILLALSSGQRQDFSIFDTHPGNKYSRNGRLFDHRVNSHALKYEASVDYFSGLLFGLFPYYSPDVYRADVHDYRMTASGNLTASLKFEFMNFVKVDFEVELVPLLFQLGVSMYQNSLFEDNCAWSHVELEAFTIKTRMTKNFV
jgi:hypothetical protein